MASVRAITEPPWISCPPGDGWPHNLEVSFFAELTLECGDLSPLCVEPWTQKSGDKSPHSKIGIFSLPLPAFPRQPRLVDAELHQPALRDLGDVHRAAVGAAEA